MSSLNALGLLLLLASAAPAGTFSIPDGYFACAKDDDCVEVDDGCCGCSGYGRRAAINKARGADYRALIEREFPRCFCRGAESNHPSCRKDLEPRCAAGRCGLAPSPTGAMRSARVATYELANGCRTDAECVLVDEGCCGCPDGGRRSAVLSSALPAYRAALEEKCAGVNCRGLNSTHQSCQEGVTAGCRIASSTAKTGHCGFKAPPPPAAETPASPVSRATRWKITREMVNGCRADEDCALVSANFCPCDGGGTRVSVLREFLPDHARALAGNALAHCAALTIENAGHLTCTPRASPLCRRGRCTFRYPVVTSTRGR